MVRCLPLGICSWNYRLEDENGNWAELRFNTFSEGGEMIVNGTPFTIEKKGILTDSWSLFCGGEEKGNAWKTNAFTRTIDGNGADGCFHLEAESIFSRTLIMRTEIGTVSTISPDHAFTRRATIEGEVPDFTTTCFGFWLTAMTWRRAERRNTTRIP